MQRRLRSIPPLRRLRSLHPQDGGGQVLHHGVRHDRHPAGPRHVQLHRREAQQLLLLRHQQAQEGTQGQVSIYIYTVAAGNKNGWFTFTKFFILSLAQAI